MQENGFLLILINILPWEMDLLINGTVNVEVHCFNKIRKQGTQKIKMHKEGHGCIYSHSSFSAGGIRCRLCSVNAKMLIGFKCLYLYLSKL